MQHGLLASLELFANNNTTLWQVPSGYVATVNINITNRNETDGVYGYIALIDGPANCLEDKDWIFYKKPINVVCERTGIVLREGQTIVVKTTSDNCSAHVWGFLQPVSVGLPC